MVIPPGTAYATTLHLTVVAIAIWCVPSSLERIVVAQAFRFGRPLGNDLAALTRGRVIPAILSSWVCAPGALLAVPGARLILGLALPFATGATVAVLLLGIIGCTAWLSVATGGSDGADKIALVACTAATTIALGRLSGDAWLCLAGVVWGAGQVTIAYATSGVAKLVRGFWRDGTALAATMTSYRSGHALAARAVHHRPVATAIAWAVMLVEATFPFALAAPPAVCVAALAAMAIFHFGTAFVMGLNTYPWAFIATYPCVLMANGIIVGAWQAAG